MSYRWRHGIVTSLGMGFLVAASVLMPATALATSTGTGALRISPALSNIQLSAGDTSKTITATVTNQTTAPLVVDLRSQDFGALLNRAGAISFYGKDYNPYTNPHGLQSAVSFTASKITLAPQASQTVLITLNNVDRLAAGGHYGAVLFSPESLAAGATNTKVSIHSAVAALIFLTTASGGTQALSLLPFSISSVRFSLPATNYVAFSDTGNSQTSPQGQLTLYSPNGKIASTTVLNPGSGLILPGTSRLFELSLPLPNMRFARPGMYRLELLYKSGSDTHFTVVNKYFYYINLTIFLPVVVLIATLLYIGKRYGKHASRITRKVAKRRSKTLTVKTKKIAKL